MPQPRHGRRPPRRPAPRLPRPLRGGVQHSYPLDARRDRRLSPFNLRVHDPVPEERYREVLRMTLVLDASFFFAEIPVESEAWTTASVVAELSDIHAKC